MVLSGIDGVRLERQTVELVSRDDWVVRGLRVGGKREKADGDTPEGKVEITWKLFPPAASMSALYRQGKRFSLKVIQ